MPERDTYKRALELYRMIPPLSEEAISELTHNTIGRARVVVLLDVKDSKKTEVLLERRYKTIVNNLGGKPNALFLACFTAMESAGMFLLRLGDAEEQKKRFREEKAYRDAEIGLEVIGTYFTLATDPVPQFRRMKLESNINTMSAERNLNPEQRARIAREWQNHQRLYVDQMRGFIESGDSTGFVAMDQLIDNMDINPSSFIRREIYPPFALAGAGLLQSYYKALYPLANEVVKHEGNP